MKFVVPIPIILISLWVAIKGFIIEWNGCESFIRPLGHVGLFLGIFVTAHLLDMRGGSIAVGMLSLFTSNNTNLPEVLSTALITCGLYVLADAKMTYDMIALGVAIINIPFPIMNVMDAFAHSGHIAILVASAAVTSPIAFLLGSFIVSLISLTTTNILSVCLTVSAAVYFYVNLSEMTEDCLPHYWSSRTLWQCRHGSKTTLCVVLYAAALLWQGTLIKCNANISYGLHALHVGGIIAICVFIYPQISISNHIASKVVVTCAALSDCTISTLRLSLQGGEMRDDLYYCLVLKTSTSFLSAIGLSLVEQLDETSHLRFHERPTKTYTMLRLSCAVLYVTCSLTLSLFLDNLTEILADATHYCLIVGGLAIEAILNNDTLLSRLTCTLLLFEIIGGVIDMLLFENNGVRVVIALPLIISMPQRTSSLQGTLSFGHVNNIIANV